jgi:benzodiazapine receptor
MIIATIATFYPVIGAWALGLLLPYLVWVSYASALTIWLWRNNPKQVRLQGASPGREAVACPGRGWARGPF